MTTIFSIFSLTVHNSVLKLVYRGFQAIFVFMCDRKRGYGGHINFKILINLSYMYLLINTINHTGFKFQLHYSACGLFFVHIRLQSCEQFLQIKNIEFLWEETQLSTTFTLQCFNECLIKYNLNYFHINTNDP